MDKNKKKKIFILDEEMFNESKGLGLTAISLVDQPAIEKDFFTYSKQDKKIKSFVKFEQILNHDKKEITGLVMRANFDIVRYDDVTGEEYYHRYTPSAIELIRNRFFKEDLIHSTNIMHEGSMKLTKDEIYLIESYIVSDSKKAPDYFGEVENGSWICTYKILDENLWRNIKEGKLLGFSVEGYLPHRELLQELPKELIDNLPVIDLKKELRKIDVIDKYIEVIINEMKATYKN